MKTKVCPRCNVEKLRTDFYKCKPSKDGLAVYCIECAKINYKLNREKSKEQEKIYREKNKERIKQVRKEYREKNIEKIREKERIKSKIKSKIYYQKNKEIINEKYKEKNRVYAKEYRINNAQKIRDSKNYKRKTNHLFRLKCNIRNLILISIRKNNYTKKSKTYQILGCSFEEFKNHLESKFQTWMNWDNYGNPKDGIIELNKTWDIDHIIPISSAKTEEDILKLNHYTNLQPLCSYTNRNVKRNKI